jgi:hypothetical protein
MAVAHQYDIRFATLLFKSFQCIFLGFKQAQRPAFTCKMMAQTLDENRQVHEPEIEHKGQSGSPSIRNSDKYIQQGIANCIFYLLQKWPGVNGSSNISVLKIGMLAMQIMPDMMMDLMNKIAREAAMILEKDGQRTLTVHGIVTAASLILRDGKDAHWPHSCTTMLEMNIKEYANYLYNKWWDCICKERAAVPMAAAQPPPPPYPILE